VVAPDALAAEAETIAAAIARLAPPLVRSARRAVREGLDLPLAAGLTLEGRLALTARATRARESA
jgi:enoyl-CoA hydratase/carnithine racemase